MRYVIYLILLANVAPAANFNVSLTNVRFTPPDLTINVGDAVTWNCNEGFHDTVSGSSGVPSGVWNSNNQYRRLMFPGESFSFTFTTPGTYPYYCTPHWTFGMVGTIRVVAPNLPPTVSIISPADQANFPAPADLVVEANASDFDGSVRQVEFFMDGSPIGVFSAPPYRLPVSNLGPGNYTFSVVATDDANATGAASVSVTVSGQQPTITAAPQSQIVNVGSDVTFTVQASGSAPLGYVWFFGPNAVPGANGPSLLLTNVSSAEAGTYTVQVSNDFGSASAAAILTVTNPPSGTLPSITTHPRSQTVETGSNVTFTVTVIGSQPLTWQWFLNRAPLRDATNSTLEIWNVGPANAGEYFVTVSNAFGSAASLPATLTVVVPPVCDFVFSMDSVSVGAGGGTDTVAVATATNCAWTVVNTNTWILVTSGNGATGPGTVSFTVSSNSTRTARSGVLLIAGITFTVTQVAALFLAKNDFNHDGQTDILWQNIDGRVSLWLMDGVARIGALPLRKGRPAVPGSRIAGTHDFDLDRNVDILWQLSGGTLQIWFMNGTNYLRTETIAPAPALGPEWQVAGLGDFDRDFNADILLRHRDGYLLVWYMKGKRFLRQRLLQNGEAIPPVWQVVGVADLNGDGYADILWQKPNSAIVVWFMAGEVPTGGPLLSHLPRLDAGIVGLNDLNQDGQPDFIWRHADGHLSVWWMNQTNRLGSGLINSGQIVPSAWKFAAPRN